MEVIKTDIEGVLIIGPKVFGDKRGYFFESFVQDNESMSSYGVMRGLHFQKPPYTQRNRPLKVLRELKKSHVC